jgi:hypothetical protein
VSVKHRRLNCAAPFELNEDSIVARLGQSEGKGDHCWKRALVAGVLFVPGRCTRYLSRTRERKRRHRDRTGRMDVRKYREVALHEGGMPEHSHVQLKVGSGSARCILHAKCKLRDALVSKRSRFALPDDAPAISELK